MSTKYTGNQIKHLGKAGIRSALKNRALRSKLPDSYLPKPLLARRHAQAKAHAQQAHHAAAGSREVVPGSGLTKNAYDRAISNATKIKYGPQERELGRQLGVNQAQQTRDSGWFDQYQAKIGEATQQQDARNAALSAQIAQFGQTGVQGSLGQKDQQGQSMHDVAATQGVATDPGLQPAADNAMLIRQALTNSFGAQTALQNGAQSNLLGMTGLGAAAAKIEHMGGLSSSAHQILKDQQGLAADKGAYKVQYGQDLKDQAHKTVLENETFGLNTAKAQATARHQRNTEKIGRTNARTTRKNSKLAREKAAASQGLAERKFASAQEKDTYQRNHHLGPYKPAATKKDTKTNAKGETVTPVGTKIRTPAQHDKLQTGMDKWKGYVAKSKGKGRHAVANAIMGDPKGPGELATSVLLDITYDGHVSRRNRQRLWAAGYSLKQLGLPGPAKAKKKTGAQAYNGPH